MLFHIIKKQVKLSLRDKTFFIFMIIFPIALIFVLGSVLQNAFTDDADLGKVDIVYTLQADANMNKAFDTFANEASDKSVSFKQVEGVKAGQEKVKNGDATALIVVKTNDLKVIANSPGTVEKARVDGYINAFAGQYQLAMTAAKINPTQVNTIMAENAVPENAISVQKLQTGDNVSSFQYYAIALIGMTMMFGMMSGVNTFRIEKLKHTDLRLLIAPIRKEVAITGNFIGELVVQAISLVILMAVSQFFFGVNWGSATLLIAAIYFSLAIFSVSFGMAIDVFTNGNAAGGAVSSILVQIFAFLGGAYFPGVSPVVQKLSPIGWANIGIRDVLYNGQLASAVMPLVINIGFALLFILLMAVVQKRKEVY
ncbi:ABC transporter permease [Listeria fleischmannii]|uniref:ABC transporter permease n=1 Tax=Listeria fleischmannii TaxID=1069827 RepID=UPI00162943C4|nr:ABC transporter permease [Listeria fleischmannii]MBC1418927.1 ABC transporter permease [Listeria fleischmannii]